MRPNDHRSSGKATTVEPSTKELDAAVDKSGHLPFDCLLPQNRPNPDQTICRPSRQETGLEMRVQAVKAMKESQASAKLCCHRDAILKQSAASILHDRVRRRGQAAHHARTATLLVHRSCGLRCMDKTLPWPKRLPPKSPRPSLSCLSLLYSPKQERQLSFRPEVGRRLVRKTIPNQNSKHLMHAVCEKPALLVESAPSPSPLKNMVLDHLVSTS